jgi:hypothetical protein
MGPGPYIQAAAETTGCAFYQLFYYSQYATKEDVLELLDLMLTMTTLGQSMAAEAAGKQVVHLARSAAVPHAGSSNSPTSRLLW